MVQLPRVLTWGIAPSSQSPEGITATLAAGPLAINCVLATMCVAVQVTNASADADGFEFAILLVRSGKEIKLISQGVNSLFWVLTHVA